MSLALGAAAAGGATGTVGGRGDAGADGPREDAAAVERQRGPHLTTGGDSAAAGTLAGPPQGDARPRGDRQPGERCRPSPLSAATMVYIMRASPRAPRG